MADINDVKVQMTISKWKDAFRLPIGYEHIGDLMCDDAIDVDVFSALKQLKEGGIISKVENGTSFYIYGGTPGTGKTSWSIELAKTYYSFCKWKLLNGYEVPDTPVVFVSVNNFLELQKESFDNEDRKVEFHQLRENMEKACLLILDDIGVCQGYSEFDESTISSLIYKRMGMGPGYSTIFTSNRSPGDLKRVINPRAHDRVFHKKTIIYHINSKKSKR